MNDINIGQITEALNNKVDLPSTPPRGQDQIDYVVDWQVPTADNNYTWYRKYKSGWVEQGSDLLSSSSPKDINVIYPIPFADNHYTLTIGLVTTKDDAIGLQWVGAKSKTSTGCVIRVDNIVTKSWFACGMAA